MSKVVKLNESDIERIVKRVIKEGPFDWDEVLANQGEGGSNKWNQLERELSYCIEPLIEKYSTDFGNDSYAVIDAIYQIMDGMFQKKRM